MTKHMFLGAAALIAAPALAQQAPAPAQTSAQAVPQQGATQAAPATTPATEPQAAPADTQAAPADAQSAPADATTAAEPKAGGDQVASVVDQEFPSYDKDGDGKLSQAEFAAWMVTLKTASDPSTKADAPATKTWVNAAFAQADTDKSKSLTKTELTGFLSQGQS
jgi:hypothetical protein